MEPPSVGQGVGAGGAYTAPGSGGSGTEGALSPSSQLLLLLQLLSEGEVEWVAGGPGGGGAPKNSLESCSGSQLYQRWGLPPSPQPQQTKPANEVRVAGRGSTEQANTQWRIGGSPLAWDP